jgi:hypothetical protein
MILDFQKPHRDEKSLSIYTIEGLTKTCGIMKGSLHLIIQERMVCQNGSFKQLFYPQKGIIRA